MPSMAVSKLRLALLVPSILVFLLPLTGCTFGSAKHQSTIGPIKDLVDSDAQVQAFRISHPVDPVDGGYPLWPEISGPVAPNRTMARRLVVALLDPANFGSPSKACSVSPGVKIRFSKANGKADIFFCFECLILVTYRNDERKGLDNFDPGRDEFVDIVKQLFPNDPVIQAMR